MNSGGTRRFNITRSKVRPAHFLQHASTEQLHLVALIRIRKVANMIDTKHSFPSVAFFNLLSLFSALICSANMATAVGLGTRKNFGNLIFEPDTESFWLCSLTNSLGNNGC